MSKEITQKEVKELFTYSDGNLYWRVKPQSEVNIGDLAGSKYSNERIYIKCKFGRFLCHRLIYLYFKGYIPEYIDHIDGDGLNNKIENLRKCTLKQNQWNRKSNKNNKSGVKGVYFCNTHKRFVVAVRFNGKKVGGKTFDNIADAKVAADDLRSKLHKEFANHG